MAVSHPSPDGPVTGLRTTLEEAMAMDTLPPIETPHPRSTSTRTASR
jgi:hypothetical protein